MSKVQLVLVLICVTLCVCQIKAQNTKNDPKQPKHHIGCQYNPFIDFDLGIDFPNKPNVYALRYGYSFHPNIIVGAEYSGHRFENDNKIGYSRQNWGLFARYSFSIKYVKPFAEISAYHSKDVTKIYIDNHFFKTIRDYVSGYIAPGVSIQLIKRRIGLDVFYKFTNETFVNDKKNVISYRLSVNF